MSSTRSHACPVGISNRPASATPDKPVIVLVHGAFADASSWAGSIVKLKADGPLSRRLS